MSGVGGGESNHCKKFHSNGSSRPSSPPSFFSMRKQADSQRVLRPGFPMRNFLDRQDKLAVGYRMMIIYAVRHEHVSPCSNERIIARQENVSGFFNANCGDRQDKIMPVGFHEDDVDGHDKVFGWWRQDKVSGLSNGNDDNGQDNANGFPNGDYVDRIRPFGFPMGMMLTGRIMQVCFPMRMMLTDRMMRVGFPMGIM